MTIIEWFDPTNIEHLKAFQEMFQEGFWPKDFIPKDMKFPEGWCIRLTSKLVNLYLEEKLR